MLFSRKESSTRQKEVHEQHEILLQDNKKFDKKSDAILSAINSTQTRLNELFVLFSLVLGTSYGGYKINHYDDVLHICFGVIGSVIAYIIINLYTNKEIRENIKTVFFGIFIFMFSVAIGNLWEVLEFLLDVMFKINCQAGGLNDTMVDMIDGIIGAIISLPFLLRKL